MYFFLFQRNLLGVEEDAMDILQQPPPAAPVAPPSPVAAPIAPPSPPSPAAPALPQPPAPVPQPPPAQLVIGPGVFGRLPPLPENCIELRSGNVERRFQGGLLDAMSLGSVLCRGVAGGRGW